MGNYKMRVNNEAESKEVQEFLFELGFGWHCGDIKDLKNLDMTYLYAYAKSKDITCGSNESCFINHENKELTIPQLRDLVVLKRNSFDDAQFIDEHMYKWYVCEDGKRYRFQGDKFIYQPYAIEFDLKPIEKPMTEDNQRLVDRSDLFDKIRKGKISFDFSGMQNEHILGVQIDEFSAIDDKQFDWLEQRVKRCNDNRKTITVTVTPNDIKLQWFKKFLDGVSVQYRVIGSQGWQNLTWKSLDKMKLNIEFREKPTTIEVDGMKFDTIDELTAYLKSMTKLK